MIRPVTTFFEPEKILERISAKFSKHKPLANDVDKDATQQTWLVDPLLHCI